jgi:hypothetical protein
MLGFFYASFIQFPLGYLLLQRKPQQQGQGQGRPLQPAVAIAAAASQQAGSSSITAVAAAASQQANSAGASKELAATLQEQPLSHVQAQNGTVKPALLQQQGGQAAFVTHQQQQQEQMQMLLKGIFTPPVIACLLAVPVASFPALRSALFDSGGEHRRQSWLYGPGQIRTPPE